MTPLPKRRHSTHRQGKRRNSQKMAISPLQACPNCGKLRRSHFVCPQCGFYKGKVAVVKKQAVK